MAYSQPYHDPFLNQGYISTSMQPAQVLAQDDLGIMQYGEESWQKVHEDVTPQFDNTIASSPQDVSGPDTIDLTENNVGHLYIIPQLEYSVGRHNTPGYSPVTFRCGGRDGVPLYVVENRSCPGLEDAQALITFGDRVKISHRLRVLGLYGTGYDLDKQVPSRRATTTRDCLTRHTVGRHVAKSVRECMANSNNEWIVSNGVTLHFENLILVDMKNVSEGSWQPTLGYYA
ncbi:hypothetical protein NM688_g4217 [Phlebia brevispora]|uniref:Uncharacterized protein n=1 Tax=Phlebia brevispora TaxID=194682 RepID=A0ACC1T3R0_9APHY|nr:hypothetical protein NM688_g4217 [Phlebia brevispora]